MADADPYATIAAYYDLEHAGFRDDVDFYLSVLRAGPVLEVGAGTGRLTLPLVRSGLEVWGVDTSPAMLSRARDKLAGYPGGHLMCGNILDLLLDVQFAAILLPLNALWHFADVEEQVRLLRQLRSRLQVDGMLVIDVSNPFTMVDRGTHGEMRQRFRIEESGRYIAGYSAAWDDPGRQQLQLSLSYEETASDGTTLRRHARLDLRYVYRFELELLLRLTDFQLDRLYGTYDREDYGEDSPNLIAVASPA